MSKPYTLEEALSKVYIVKVGGNSGKIVIPKVLLGKRVMITLVVD